MTAKKGPFENPCGVEGLLEAKVTFLDPEPLLTLASHVFSMSLMK
jgi:hypothetical protein